MKPFQFLEFAGDRFPNTASWEVGVGQCREKTQVHSASQRLLSQGAFTFPSYPGRLCPNQSGYCRESCNNPKSLQLRSKYTHTHTHSLSTQGLWRSGGPCLKGHTSCFLAVLMSQLETSLGLSKKKCVSEKLATDSQDYWRNAGNVSTWYTVRDSTGILKQALWECKWQGWPSG